MNMMTKQTLLRPAERQDADSLAWFINAAGHGMPLEYWTELAAPGQDPWEIGRQRMAVNSGDNSWRNWTIAERNGAAAGGLCTYQIPSDMERPGDDVPLRFRPLAALEYLARGTWHVHVLATSLRHRRAGVGTRLLAHAARQAAGRPQSILVDSGNAPACALYKTVGFIEAARRPIVDRDGKLLTGDWLLLMR
ncbi:GNAT family N-acetyltransferase [Actibacterium ureilyticum]|uniref:GNAT family N-acetyltransferase n=1 Tax=Actibacterium ureilyticum TaxID=1590614 RepID=UPI00159588EB|nr:GNAT family N-acetyltransferase [Actibacterium ureilyticum]